MDDCIRNTIKHDYIYACGITVITISPEFIISLHLSDCVILFVSFFPPASLCSSASPYHEVMRMERRLRSSSEGAGGPRIHGNHREAPGMEGCGLLKHRNNSSSSKLGSLVGLKLSVFVCLCVYSTAVSFDDYVISSCLCTFAVNNFLFIYIYFTSASHIFL